MIPHQTQEKADRASLPCSHEGNAASDSPSLTPSQFSPAHRAHLTRLADAGNSAALDELYDIENDAMPAERSESEEE